MLECTLLVLNDVFGRFSSYQKRTGQNLAKSQRPEIRFVRKLTFKLGRPWRTGEVSGISLIPRSGI